jgi:hypothetical protein
MQTGLKWNVRKRKRQPQEQLEWLEQPLQQVEEPQLEEQQPPLKPEALRLKKEEKLEHLAAYKG